MNRRSGVLLRRLAPPPPTASPTQPSPPPTTGGKRGFSLANFNPLAQGTLTLSFEGTSARLLLVQGGVKRWQDLALSPRFFRNGVVADAPGIGQALAQEMRQSGLGRGRLVCALPAAQAATRLIALPPGARGNINALVAREVRRLMPVAEETNYLFWQVLPPRAGQIRAYALTVPKAPLMALVEGLRAAGLKPRSLELKPLALARAVGRPETIIVNGESNSLDVVIVTEGVPTILRSVFLGDPPPPSEVAQTRLLEELTRTISFYNDTNRDRPLGPEVPVFVTGEMALNPGLGQEIASTTGRSVPPLDSPLPGPPDFPLALFMVNLGLALKKT